MKRREDRSLTYTLFLICKNNYNSLKDSIPIILSMLEAKDIIAFVSPSIDRTADILRENCIRVVDVSQSEFGHGRTRNLSLKYSRSDIFIFLNGDAVPVEGWFENLTRSISKSDAAFSRQIPNRDCDPLRFTDLIHHPYFRSKDEIIIPNESVNKIMFDTVSCAIKRELLSQHRFPDVPFGEDIIWAREVISCGKRIAYSPDSIVIHSHSLYRDIRSLIRRHFEEGRLSSIIEKGVDIGYFIKFLPSAFILDMLTIYFMGRSMNIERLFWILKEPILRSLQLLSFIVGLNHKRIPDILKKRLAWQ